MAAGESILCEAARNKNLEWRYIINNSENVTLRQVRDVVMLLFITLSCDFLAEFILNINSIFLVQEIFGRYSGDIREIFGRYSGDIQIL